MDIGMWLRLSNRRNTEHVSTLVTKHIGKTGAFIGC